MLTPSEISRLSRSKLSLFISASEHPHRSSVGRCRGHHTFRSPPTFDFGLDGLDGLDELDGLDKDTSSSQIRAVELASARLWFRFEAMVPTQYRHCHSGWTTSVSAYNRRRLNVNARSSHDVSSGRFSLHTGEASDSGVVGRDDNKKPSKAAMQRTTTTDCFLAALLASCLGRLLAAVRLVSASACAVFVWEGGATSE